MLRIYLLLSLYLSPNVRVSGLEELKLGIYNESGGLVNNNYLPKNVNDTLILLCKPQFDNVKSTPKLSWILPITKNRPNSASRPHKVLIEDGIGVQLIIENLQESDHGEYVCVDRNGNKNGAAMNVSLFIRRPIDCGKGVFCDDHCLLERFKCDGVVDCKNENDESLHLCGRDPCQDKLRCKNGRCIPQSWCCNSSSENCTRVKWKIMCCPIANRETYPHDYEAFPNTFHETGVMFREFSDRPINYLNNPHQYTDLNFLQTTIYAVFGCAIFFILIVTVLVVVMQCKLQMRRNWQFQLLNRQRMFGNNTYHRTFNQEMDIMDMVLERYNQGNSRPREQQHQQRNARGLLVTYNINNGVQIVGKPIEPPPYSEVAPSPPRDQGPPPPYHPSSEEGEEASSTSRKSGHNERRGLSKGQASSEPTLTNIN